MAPPRLTIVMPVFNEAARLPATIAALGRHLDAQQIDAEIVAVDDGSTDASLALLTDGARRDPRWRVRALGHNRGKGAAVRDGMLAARGAVALFMDTDLATDLGAIEPALRAIGAGTDLVVGSRRAPGATVVVRQSRVRERSGQLFSWLAARLIDPAVDDFTCGFKACSRRAIDAIFSRSRIDGWAFDAEVIAIAREQGLSIAMLPVTWTQRGASSVRFPAAVLTSLRDLLRIRCDRRRGRYAPPR